ncbi:hypothetical protein [Dickeya dadantii]|uniref:hypothetical protein n=1 Tax=Dickeya dadantii TaxID=204038 RepID=UPI0011159081|nr:hypothetical protein [Dickeya dadantii]
MERFISAIRKSVDDSNWMSAMCLAITMPDICGGIEWPGDKNNSERFKNWFNQNLKIHYDPENNYESLMSARPNILKEFSGNPYALESFEKLKFEPVAEHVRLNADDFWKLRCKLLHDGRGQVRKGKNIIPSPKPEEGYSIHKAFMGGLFYIQVDIFCEDMCIAVESWYNKKIVGSRALEKRVDKLIKITPFPI